MLAHSHKFYYNKAKSKHNEWAVKTTKLEEEVASLQSQMDAKRVQLLEFTKARDEAAQAMSEAALLVSKKAKINKENVGESEEAKPTAKTQGPQEKQLLEQLKTGMDEKLKGVLEGKDLNQAADAIKNHLQKSFEQLHKLWLA